MIARASSAIFLSFMLSLTAAAQVLEWVSTDPLAVESFRLGVQSFHRGSFNEAILEHEKALAAAPGDPLILSWLARSYYRSGLEATSIDRWRQAAAAGGNSPFLESRREFISSRRMGASGPAAPERLIETGRILSNHGKTMSFRRPSWILPMADGSSWVVGYGSNDLLRYDANGIRGDRFVGPLGGLDRPYAMVPRASGGYWVSEHNSDRVTALSSSGSLVVRIGASGSGPGQFLGPGALACDDAGYLFVCDYGNRRIDKFSDRGEFISSFGGKAGGFPGLMAPTGLAWMGGSLFVVDRGRKAVYEFDRDGNYLRVLADAERGLNSPEGISAAEGSILLVTDGDRIWAIDSVSEEMVLIHASQERGTRYAHAAMDANGSVIACDFNGSVIVVLTPASLVYSGLFVNVLRMDASAFPTVRMEVMVQDARGRPLTGLARRNFYISERLTRREDRLEGGKRVEYRVDSFQPPLATELMGELGATEPSLDSVVLFDGSRELTAALPLSRESLARALIPLSSLGKISWAFAARVPTAEVGLSPAAAIARRMRSPGAADWRFDASLRLAASSLAAAGPRRTVFLISAGSVSDTPFDSYSLSDLAAYLSNNAISFVSLILGGGRADPALEYLAEQTGGGVYALDRPQGLSPILEELSKRRTGMYSIRFESAADSEFGRKYMPISVEVYLMKKSGRDEIGYFAPLR